MAGPPLTPDRWAHPTAFAPLEGVGHETLRALVAARGGLGLVCAPFLSIGQVPAPASRLARLVAPAPGVPLSVQLLGTHPKHLSDAAAVLASAGADVIDVNLGCPAKHAVARGAGAGLLSDPDAVLRLLARVRTAVPGTLSAKMRLGLEDTAPAFAVAEAAAAAGVDFLTVHPRRRCDYYAGVANWRWIREIAARLPVPVVGNGDCWYADDALRMIAETGCAAVMIGRPALRNPWIFSQIEALRAGRDPVRPSGDDVVAWLKAVAAGFAEGLRSRRGVTGHVKELVSYLGRAVEDGGAFRTAALRAQGLERILGVAEERLAGLPPDRLDLQAHGPHRFEHSGGVRSSTDATP